MYRLESHSRTSLHSPFPIEDPTDWTWFVNGGDTLSHSRALSRLYAPLTKHCSKYHTPNPRAASLLGSTDKKSHSTTYICPVPTQMAVPASSVFFTVPLELREQIYKNVIVHQLCGHQVLRTCREIYNEAQKFFFQRPLFFHGQAELYLWLDKAPQKHLYHVTEIILELHEVDLTRILSQPSSSASTASHAPRLQAWDLHEKELDKLCQTLLRLPNVQTLTVCALPERQSFLYREFLARFLSQLHTIYPNLKSLILAGNFHHQELHFLSTLTNLQSISLDGFSATSATSTATILSTLPNLTSLSLASQHSMLTPTTHTHSTFTSKRQSITADLFLATQRLTSFTLYEHSTSYPASAPLFFTPSFLTSLSTNTTLSCLTIKLSHPPRPTTLGALESYLEHTNSLARLELDWPFLTSEVLEEHLLVPACIEEVWLRVAGGLAGVFDVLWGLLEGREEGDLERLTRVVLLRGEDGGDEDEGDEEGEENEEVEEDKSFERSFVHSGDITRQSLPREELSEEDEKEQEPSSQSQSLRQDRETQTQAPDHSGSPTISNHRCKDVEELNDAVAVQSITNDHQHQTEHEHEHEHDGENDKDEDKDEDDINEDAPRSTSTDASNVSRVIRRLNALGIRVLWSTDEVL